MKSLKKIIAGAMAVVMTATIGALNITASAASVPVRSYSWKTTYRDQANTGTYTGTKDFCYMMYSPDGYKVSLMSMSCKLAGTYGTVTAVTTSTEVEKVSTKLTRVGETNTIKVNPIKPLYGVQFEIYSTISPAGNYVEASGEIVCVE